MDFITSTKIYSNNIAFINDDLVEYTYKDVYNFSVDINLHINSRDLILQLCENIYESVTGYLSFINKKAVPLLIDSNINSNFLIKLLTQYKPKFIYLPKDKLNKLDHKDIVYENNNYYLVKTTYLIDYVLSNKLALLLSTSGSTGSPKFVKLSYENIFANTNSIIEYLKIKTNDVAMTTLPSHYSFMLSIINSHFIRGASTVLTNHSMMEKDFWTLLENAKVTTFSGVPFTYEILQKLKFHKMKLGSIRYITQAGGKLNNNLTKYFIDSCEVKKIDFFIMYGQTEATARMSYLPLKFQKEKIGSIGIAIPDGKFTLANDGELIYQGQNVSMGYSVKYNDLSISDENNNILYTGDIATVDEDGYYFVIGRKKRFVKIYGHRINLDEIERILIDNSYSCICVGNDNKIVIYGLEKDIENAIILLVSKMIKINKKVFKYIYVPLFLRNKSGKILYPKMEDLYGL